MPNFTGHFAVPSVARGLAIVRNFARNLFQFGIGSEPGGVSLDPEIDDVRVEAFAKGATILRWSYSGGSSVGVYRSTDGLTYTLVDTVAAGTTEYTDDGLAEVTKYWYRLSADSGASVSLAVTVVTYLTATTSHGGIVNASVMTARRAKEAYASQKDFNELVLQLEQEENVKDVQSTPCNVCLNDGAIIIDCSTGCEWFQVVMDESINSISIIGCDGCPRIKFVIPPETTLGICGWPIGCGYTGDECFEAPVEGGPYGREATTDGSTVGGYGGPSGGGGQPSATCPCPPATKRLTIKCCGGYGQGATPETPLNPDICDFWCFNGISSDDPQQQIKFKACGGLAQYDWTTNYPEFIGFTTSENGSQMTATWIAPFRENSCFDGNPTMWDAIAGGSDGIGGTPATITVTDMTKTSVTRIVGVTFP